MIIRHLCTSLSGGASVAAQRLHRTLRAHGLDSRFSFSARDRATSHDENITPICWPTPETFSARATELLSRSIRRVRWQWDKFRHLRSRPPGFELFTPAELPGQTLYDPQALPGEILHLHWIAKLFDYPSFLASVGDSTPIVWTLHDMNPFTGGCHFSAGCERFTSGCGNCPQIAARHPSDLSHRQWHIKQAALRHVALHVVAPSRWLLDAAQHSPLFAQAGSFHHIPYGIHTDQFQPVDRDAARGRFAIPSSHRVIGFGADSLTNRRKGWQELLAALQQLRPVQPTVALVFGGGELPHPQQDSQLQIRSVGFIRDRDTLLDVYSAMDFFVLPSLEDNLPQTGLEAMACGTPVVAFAAGGIPDFVLPAQTGLLARVGDARDLAGQMQKLLDDPAAVQCMGREARRLIVEQFDSSLEGKRYVALYSQVLAASRSSPRLQAA